MLDVNILVRANERSHGPARALLLALIEQGHTLLISSEMLVELVTVLRYPRLQALYGLSDEQIYDYVQLLRSLCEPVTLGRTIPVPIRDPKDVAVLQTAVLGEAGTICTLDADFYASETRDFCAAMGMEICTDTELLNKITTNP